LWDLLSLVAAADIGMYVDAGGVMYIMMLYNIGYDFLAAM